jgi:hypothetical protein
VRVDDVAELVALDVAVELLVPVLELVLVALAVAVALEVLEPVLVAVAVPLLVLVPVGVGGLETRMYCPGTTSAHEPTPTVPTDL